MSTPRVEIVLNGASPEVEQAARAAIDRLVTSLPPENAALLARHPIHFHVIPAGAKLTDLPPYAHLKGAPTHDGRTWDGVRGIGGRLQDGVVLYAIGEEQLSPTMKSGYGQDHAATHETGHIIHQFGLTLDQQRIVEILYRRRLADPSAAWISPASYTKSTVGEYFANSVAAYYSASHARKNDGTFTPEWLRANDPRMFALLQHVFGPPRAPGEEPPPSVLRFAGPEESVLRFAIPDRPAEKVGVGSGTGSGAKEPPLTPEPSSARSAWWWALPVGIVVLLAAVLGGFFALRDGGGDGDGRASRASSAEPARDGTGGPEPTSPAPTAAVRVASATAGCNGTDHFPAAPATDGVSGQATQSPSKQTICLTLADVEPGMVVRVEVTGPRGPVTSTGVVTADGKVCIEIPLFQYGSYTITAVTLVDGAAEQAMDVTGALGATTFEVAQGEQACGLETIAAGTLAAAAPQPSASGGGPSGGDAASPGGDSRTAAGPESRAGPSAVATTTSSDGRSPFVWLLALGVLLLVVAAGVYLSPRFLFAPSPPVAAGPTAGGDGGRPQSVLSYAEEPPLVGGLDTGYRDHDEVAQRRRAEAESVTRALDEVNTRTPEQYVHESYLERFESGPAPAADTDEGRCEPKRIAWVAARRECDQVRFEAAAREADAAEAQAEVDRAPGDAAAAETLRRRIRRADEARAQADAACAAAEAARRAYEACAGGPDPA